MSSEPDEVKYPFTDAAVLESELRDWLARVLYPSEYQRGGAVKSNAKRRVVARITYARANHRLKRAIKHRVVAADFFEWACEQKGWSRLKQVQGLPLNATVSVNSYPIEASSGSVSSLFLPKDKGQL